MKRISRNLTAAALAGALTLTGLTAANAADTNPQSSSSITAGENKGDQGSSDKGNQGDQGSSDKGNQGDQGSSDGDKDKKDKSSFDDLKGKLSSKDGKPTDLGIAAIVLGVLGALAAIAPAAAQALGIKLPF